MGFLCPCLPGENLLKQDEHHSCKSFSIFFQTIVVVEIILDVPTLKQAVFSIYE